MNVSVWRNIIGINETFLKIRTKRTTKRNGTYISDQGILLKLVTVKSCNTCEYLYDSNDQTINSKSGHSCNSKITSITPKAWLAITNRFGEWLACSWLDWLMEDNGEVKHFFCCLYFLKLSCSFVCADKWIESLSFRKKSDIWVGVCGWRYVDKRYVVVLFCPRLYMRGILYYYFFRLSVDIWRIFSINLNATNVSSFTPI